MSHTNLSLLTKSLLKHVQSLLSILSLESILSLSWLKSLRDGLGCCPAKDY